MEGDDSRAARIGRRTRRLALRIATYLALFVGAALLAAPLTFTVDPWTDLLVRKLASTVGGIGVLVVFGLGLYLSGAWMRRKVMDFQQHEHDRTALRIMRDLRADPAAAVADFYLYLRAFETTGKLHVPLFLRLRKLSVGLNQLATNDVESHVSSAVGRVGPLIALGRPGETIGAGRIVTDEESWRADIRTLMKRAKGILLVPSNRPGTVWEIGTLKSDGLLSKVIFIMPPRSKGEFDTKDRWEAARQALAAHGLEAPEYQERGLLFEVGPDGRVINVEPMLLNSARQVRKSLKRLLSDDPPKGGLYRAIARAEKRARRATFWGWGETSRQLSVYALAVLALFLPRPVNGFNPQESWGTVFSRFMTAKDLTERDAWPEDLLPRSLLLVSDTAVRGYIVAFGEMMSRVDTKTCEAIVRGDLPAEAKIVALTYIPSERSHDFIEAEKAAMAAVAEQRQFAGMDNASVQAAIEQVFSQLGAEDQRRFERMFGAAGLSDADRCWLVRTTYASAASLPEPHASVWARALTVMAPRSAEPAAASATPEAPPPARSVSAEAPAAKAPSTPIRNPSAVSARSSPKAPEPGTARESASTDAAIAVSAPAVPAPPALPPPPAAATPPPYSRLIDDATAAIRSGRVAEAGDIIDRMIRSDPARSEGWSLRGFLAMNAFGNLAAASESYENALARGGGVVFRLAHDHGADQPPCLGSLRLTSTGVEFNADAGVHRFEWPYGVIREAAINSLYGSQFGMFHIKAQTADNKTANFNFVAVRLSDQQIVNRRPDAEMLLALVNRRRADSK